LEDLVRPRMLAMVVR